MKMMYQDTVKWTSIYAATGLLQAVTLQKILEQAGIPVTIKYPTSSSTPDMNYYQSEEVTLSVPLDSKNEAWELINAKNRTGEMFGLFNP